MFRDPRTYTVRPGDTLYTIARRFNTTVESIMALNNMKNEIAGALAPQAINVE